MYLRFYLDDQGKRVYTFKVSDAQLTPQYHDAEDKPTISAHPARFSPDDQYSAQRMKCKERFNLLPTQQPGIKL
jgi:H/ACA ribonucleoprotein complex subunit 3